MAARTSWSGRYFPLQWASPGKLPALKTSERETGTAIGDFKEPIQFAIMYDVATIPNMGARCLRCVIELLSK